MAVTAAIIAGSVAIAGSAAGAISAHQGKQRAKGEKFRAENESEEIAVEDAVPQSELALEGAEAALETIPKTEIDK